MSPGIFLYSFKSAPDIAEPVYLYGIPRVEEDIAFRIFAVKKARFEKHETFPLFQKIVIQTGKPSERFFHRVMIAQNGLHWEICSGIIV